MKSDKILYKASHFNSSPTGLNHLSEMEFLTYINWISPFLFYGVVGWYYPFYLNFNGPFCKRNVETDQTLHSAASGLGLHCLHICLFV